MRRLRLNFVLFVVLAPIAGAFTGWTQDEEPSKPSANAEIEVVDPSPPSPGPDPVSRDAPPSPQPAAEAGTCGDGVVNQAWEQCDDAGISGFCSNSCRLVALRVEVACVNGVPVSLEPVEPVRPPPSVAPEDAEPVKPLPDSAPDPVDPSPSEGEEASEPPKPERVPAAAAATCGDGKVNQVWEQCDGGENCEGCRLIASDPPKPERVPAAAAVTCGDGMVNQVWEQCDGGENCEGCRLIASDPPKPERVPAAAAATCGDGMVNQVWEQCDDGGRSGLCSESCRRVALPVELVCAAELPVEPPDPVAPSPDEESNASSD